MPGGRIIFERANLGRVSCAADFSDPLAYMLEEHRYLFRAVEALEDFADTLPSFDASRRARTMLHCLLTDFARHEEDEDAVVALLSQQIEGSRATNLAVERMNVEHGVVQQLMHPVHFGLLRIAKGGNPEHLERLIVSVFVLCEFLRLHYAFEEMDFYPRAAILTTPQDLRNLSADMAYRRGLLARSPNEIDG
jgi:hemerythrin-like domain-containing protein